jgi:S-adenosylmethionine:tRNA ribosyltransferase-isomerase
VSAFELSSRLEAHEPPEVRGLGRDDVSMLVAARHDGALVHTRFRDLPEFVRPGDLLVVNTSATLPAALHARLDDRPVELRLSTPAAGESWIVELRTTDGQPFRRPATGSRLELEGGARAELVAPYAGSDRLFVARLELGARVEDYLYRHGHPIRYDYVPRSWPLESYQTIFAHEAGSAEMPSAGRPFTNELVTTVTTGGVLVAPLTLHTGVSSPKLDEPPYPERYRVPRETIELVEAVRRWGGRVIAVGTTVVRALETAAAPEDAHDRRDGWTNLIVTPKRGLRMVDGLLTGWHEPESSHLQLLDAVATRTLRERSYRAALAHGYLWHEFGDLHLILP